MAEATEEEEEEQEDMEDPVEDMVEVEVHLAFSLNHPAAAAAAMEDPAVRTVQAEAVTEEAEVHRAFSHSHPRLADTEPNRQHQVTVAAQEVPTEVEVHRLFCLNPLVLDTVALLLADTVARVQATAEVEVHRPFCRNLQVAADTELNRLLATVAHLQLTLNRLQAVMAAQAQDLTAEAKRQRYSPRSLHPKVTEHSPNPATAARRPLIRSHPQVATIFPLATVTAVNRRLFHRHLQVLGTVAAQV